MKTRKLFILLWSLCDATTLNTGEVEVTDIYVPDYAFFGDGSSLDSSEECTE